MNDKKIFTEVEAEVMQENFQAKQTFNPESVQIELDNDSSQSELLNEQFEQAVQPKSRLWIRLLMATMGLFLLATVAQSVQWLVDTWQAKQWIYFAFAIVAFLSLLLGLSAIGKEFLRLRHLRQHLLLQQQSQQGQFQPPNGDKSAVQNSIDFNPEQAQAFYQKIADNMQLNPLHPDLVQWKKQLSPSHTAQEVGFLFSQNILQPIDRQVKKMISQNAIESAMVVAISPLAVVDMFFIAWRNIRLINQIAQCYGIELGYFSRLRLMKLVLMNMAFTGATELMQEIGMNWLSQDMTAKLSVRVAQGIGAGLLTARLGIKAMEFCRPVAFQPAEKPKLSHIHQQLLSQLKDQVLTRMKLKQTEKM